MSQRKKSLDETRPLRSTVLEEAKRLEYLNRKIKNSSNQNIKKLIAGYRKSVSPTQKNLNNIDLDLVRYYDEVFKGPLNTLKANPGLNENGVKNDFTGRGLPRKKKTREISEFAEIEFDETLWPEELIGDERLFEGSDLKYFGRPGVKDFWTGRRGKIGNCRIKSKLGEIGRKFFRVRKMNCEDCFRRSPARVETPLVFRERVGAGIY